MVAPLNSGQGGDAVVTTAANPLDPRRSPRHIPRMNPFPLLCVGLVLGVLPVSAQRTLHTFKKVQLTDEFWAEGADFGDFNRDGHKDVAYGPNWWAGPDFKTRHEYRPATQTFQLKLPDGGTRTVPGFHGALGNQNAYSDNFFTFAHDFNGDGYDDLLIVGLPGTEAWVHENPGAGASGHWRRHKVFDVVDNESVLWEDLDGDGRPELICNTGGQLGFIQPDWSAPFSPWKFRPITPKLKYHKYTHGLGLGDVNGNGRKDFLEADGWWEQPASLAGDPEWKFHPFPFAPNTGAAQMFAYDVNGDGLNDVITCLNPHGFGLAWYEQVREGDRITFKRHLIMGATPADNPYGVKFSQPHALALVDMDGDGLKDIVTGKRFWAHGPTGDDEPNAPSVIYWFRLTRPAGRAPEYVPHLVDDNSGVGTQVSVGDLNGDGRPDIISSNKRGAAVFLQQVRTVSGEDWQAAQPKRLASAGQ